MYMHASEQDILSSFSHSATFLGLKRTKEQSLANQTQNKEYICALRHVHTDNS